MIECVSYIPPNYVTWEYSADGGATWTELDAGGIKSVKLTIESVAESDAGMAHIVLTLERDTYSSHTRDKPFDSKPLSLTKPLYSPDHHPRSLTKPFYSRLLIRHPHSLTKPLYFSFDHTLRTVQMYR